jgi:hypothetical protein
MMENAAFVLDFCKKNSIQVTFTAENLCNKEHLILILEFILNIAERMGWTHEGLTQATNEKGEKGATHAAAIEAIASPSPSPTPSPNVTPRKPPDINTGGDKGSNISMKAALNELMGSEKDFLQDMDVFFKVLHISIYFLFLYIFIFLYFLFFIFIFIFICYYFLVFYF